MLKIIITSLLLALNLSCSKLATKKRTPPINWADSKARYNFVDNAGNFVLVRESSFKKGSHQFYTKQKIVLESPGEEKIVEQSLVFSLFGRIKKQLPVLRPESSIYSVWFEGKEYSVEMKVNQNEKTMDLKLKGQETPWNGIKKVPFPKGNGIFCFFSQLVECVAATGFIQKALEEKTGRMNFYIIWNGYPYFQDQYANIPKELFSVAKMEFDGLTDQNEYRMNLEVAGQSIFYVFDTQGNFIKMFWISQGLTMTKK